MITSYGAFSLAKNSPHLIDCNFRHLLQKVRILATLGFFALRRSTRIRMAVYFSNAEFASAMLDLPSPDSESIISPQENKQLSDSCAGILIIEFLHVLSLISPLLNRRDANLVLGGNLFISLLTERGLPCDLFLHGRAVATSLLGLVCHNALIRFVLRLCTQTHWRSSPEGFSS